MTPRAWEELMKAYNFLTSVDSVTNRIDNPKWVMYRVGSNIIRIDIKVKNE